MFDGDTAFTLYDTYGFPLDLTQDALRARGISVDLASFEDAMERQREKARASWAGSGDAAQETVWLTLREKIGATEFLGYETESAEGVVAALVKDGKEVSELKKGENGAVVMNQTPFYGESGGQVGDTGEMRREGLQLTVSATQKKAGDVVAHFVTVEQGTVKVGDALLLEVDHTRRGAIRQQDSATHLLRRSAAPGAGRSRCAKRIVGCTGTAPFRFLASEADDGRGDRARRGHCQRLRPSEHAGHDAPDGSG